MPFARFCFHSIFTRLKSVFHIQSIYFAVCFSAICLLVLACEVPKNPPYIRDLIQPLSLVAGRTDTILASDLFYSETYAIEFSKNSNIEINYDTASRKLALTPKSTFEGITLIDFRHGAAIYKIPVSVKIIDPQTFKYKSTKKPEKVFLFGSFNNWNRNATPMLDAYSDGVYEATLPLKPGRYEYKFVVDGAELLDESNPVSQPNGLGGFNSIYTVKPRSESKLKLHILNSKVLPSIEGETTLNFFVEKDSTSGRLLASNITMLINNQSIPDQQLRIIDNRVVVFLKEGSLVGEKIVRIAVSQKGSTTPFYTIRLYDGIPVGSNLKNSFSVPQNQWSWSDAVMYSVMIDRFANGDSTNDNPIKHDSLFAPANYRGGDFKGIAQKIDEGYFDSLDVNVLWLSPVNLNTHKAFREYPPPYRYYSGYHGYWPIDPKEIEPHFGDMAQLKKLVQKAHQHGMKVLLDFVAHHTHIDHPYFKSHPEWFGTLDLPDGRKNLRLWDDFRLTTWFEPYLPSFDFSNQAALDTMTSNAVWWLKETGIDGFRHDAVKHVPNAFWQTLTQKIKRDIEIPEKRKIFQIGETFGGYELIKSYVNNGQLDAQFNFNLYDAALYVFLNSDASFAALDNELQNTFATYGMNHAMGNIMDSHDKVRFMALAEGDVKGSDNAGELAWTKPPKVDDKKSYEKLKLYLSYMFTIPGIPVIYYGDEFGMTGASDPDNRRMMRFGKDLNSDEQTTQSEVQKLIKLRMTHSALRHGDFQTMNVEKNTFAYLRSDVNERILTVLNKSDKSETVVTDFPKFYKASRAIDLSSGEEIKIVNDKLSITAQAWKARILKIE